MRLKLTVAYDGTDFRGWAPSPGHRTVQATLTEAVQKLIDQDVEIVGASRTDSGAHAKGQVCHFDTSVDIASSRWPTILNRVLPVDIAVQKAAKVHDDFHSRFCAEDRWYRYHIRTAARNPFESRYVYDYGRELDLEAMKQAGKLLEGKHDFRAFTEELQPHIDNTVRTIRRVDVRQFRDEVRIEIVGTAFLRGMMRRMSGALLEVGAGKRQLESIGLLLTEGEVDMHRPVVLPAKGLCLERVRYGNPPKDHRTTGSEL